MPITIKPTQLKYKDPSTSQYVSIVAAATTNGNNSSNVDVQINGTSILSNGVANIPIANTSTSGVIKVNTGGTHGLSLTDGELYIYPAGLAGIKSGSYGYLPIVPSHQHEATFYGLAKAAGDSTQSASSNEVGVYTDDAKAAIQTMLNVPSSNNPIFTGSFSLGRKANTTIGSNSFACGYNNEASGVYSYAIGESNVASSQFSFASGNGTQASGWGSHTEGQFTQATDQLAHAEGRSTIASGYAAHAEGVQTTSANMGSHAEGYMTIAYSFGSHAEGSHTIARGVGTHAFGTANVPNTAEEWIASTSYEIDDIIEYNNELFQCKTANNDATFDSSKWLGSKGTYIETVGNGIDSNRSNARALDWQGNEYLNGTLYINCNSDSTGGVEVATKTNATSSTAGLMSAADKVKLDNISQTIDLSFSIATTDWTLSNGVYTATYTSSSITSSSVTIVRYDESIAGQPTTNIFDEKVSGGVQFTTTVLPTGTISGDIAVFNATLQSSLALPSVSSSDNGKVLRVVNGEWAAVTIANANGVSF